MSAGFCFRAARVADLAACQSLFCDAFRDYDFFAIPADGAGRPAYTALMAGWAENCIACGAAFVAEKAGEVAAFAALKCPGGAAVEILLPQTAAWSVIRNIAGASAPERLMRLFAESDAPCHALPEPKWHLSALAVAGKFARQGLGSAMLQKTVIPYVTAHGGGILTFNTNTEENRGFYAKNGFLEFDIGSAINLAGANIGNFSYRMDLEGRA